MGLTLATEARGPYATILHPHRQLLIDAMKAAGVGWVVRGKDCPDCLYAHVTRASVLYVLQKVSEHVVANPRYLVRDKIQWKGGKTTSRLVLLSTIAYLQEETLDVSAATVIIEDDYRMCDHAGIARAAAAKKKKK